MWMTTAGRPAKPVGFMLRRISRIVPLYWIVTIVTAIAVTNVGTFDVIQSMLFIPRYGSFHLIVLQGWTLYYELIFYILFSVSLNLSERARYWTILLTLAAAAAVHFVLPDGYARLFTAPMILEFGAGVVVARAFTRGVGVPYGFAVMLVVVGAVGLFAVDWLQPGLDRTLRCGVPVTLLVAGAVFCERTLGAPRLALPQFLGDASYSIYLWHVLAIAGMVTVVLRMGLPAPVRPLAIVVGSVGLCSLAYLAIEKPLVRLFHPPRRPPPASVEGAGAVATTRLLGDHA
jgi:exopolysaccharide production protein ExoZ